MKENKRTPLIDFNKIQNLSKGIKIEGNILLSLYTEKEALYIITDMNYFYFKEKDKKVRELMLIPFLGKENEKYQTEENTTHLWCDKNAFHTLIYHDKRLFYFNPSFTSEIKELDLVNTSIAKGKYLEPYSLFFIENEFNKEQFEIIFSDYFSDIYSLNININDFKLKPNFLYRVRKNYIPNEENFKFEDLDLFHLERNEIITDIKIITTNKEQDEKEIIAVTKNIIFKFKGKGTYKEIFEEYSKSKEDDNILKVYKKLGSNDKKDEYEKTKIELIKSYSNNSLKKNELNLVLGWMSSIGYVTQDINKQKNFTIYPYVKINLDGKREFKSVPNMVCQSKLHIFEDFYAI